MVRTSKEYKELIKILEKLHYEAQDAQRRTKKIKDKIAADKDIDEDGLKVDFHYYLCRELILSVFDSEKEAASYLVDAEYYQPELRNGNKKLIWNCFGNVVVENVKKNLDSSLPLKVRREQYITKNSAEHKAVLKAVEEVNKELEGEKKEVAINITFKEMEWIDNQNYRKNSQTDRLLLFIFLYLQKRYGKDGWFKIKQNVKTGITLNIIDGWIGSDISKKGITRLEKEGLISTENVINQFGKYIKVHVNIPEFKEKNAVLTIKGGNPLISLFKYTGERVIKTCQICGKEFPAFRNAKTCGKLLCRRKIEKETKDKCNRETA